ncbi:hypothetical protein [Microbispora sp. KK1-11]|uniref:hypothetical protein n=1 Tax=Microbispora sp. KK1-11 TaxID=2053005 RepID=UPI001157D584|nr:hypothetical protein [Microbispora sp. KK1-11]TQS26301.1 hypothetical protein FLW16_26515 [Microbispora sp. KK1-11]
MTGPSLTVLAPILVLIAACAVDAWVYADAKEHLRRGHPAVFTFGPVRIATPEAWFLGCLIMWAVFFPLYLTVTGRNPFR